MPELPEVEVTKRGIEPSLLNHVISDVIYDDKSLRKSFSPDLKKLINSKVEKVERRAKYIVITTTQGYLLIHLGMTGHLRVNQEVVSLGLHDHFELIIEDKASIVLNDTRRFGLVEYYPLDKPPYECKPLKDLGIEPFSPNFNAQYLYSKLQRLKKSIKQSLMDNAIVVGIGNIYASEVLFACKISPLRSAKDISLDECKLLVENIIKILKSSIEKGGTTIRDFEGADGKLGYFVQNLNVYGHEGENCKRCNQKIVSITQGQRSTFYCPNCQK